jgi:hypothetical protein
LENGGTVKKTILFALFAGLISSTAAAQGPMKGTVGIRVSSVLRSGQAGGSTMVNTDILPGESDQMYAAAGPGTGGCQSYVAGGNFTDAAKARVDERLRAANYAWHFNAKLGEVSTNHIVFDIDWDRVSRVDPSDVVHDTTHFVMREGEIRPLDLVHGAPGGDCASVAIEIVADIKEDESLVGKMIDWDLWLVKDAQSSPLHIRASSLQGAEVPFQFESVPISILGAQAESLVRVSGTIKGRLRRDGDIEVEVLAQRGLENAPNSKLVAQFLKMSSLIAPNGFGRKFFTVKPGEAVKIVLPPFTSNSPVQIKVDPATGEKVTTFVGRPAGIPAAPASGAEMSVTVRAGAPGIK